MVSGAASWRAGGHELALEGRRRIACAEFVNVLLYGQRLPESEGVERVHARRSSCPSLLKRFVPFVNMAAFAQSGIVDPYELERLAEELAEREGERDVDTSYPLLLLEPLSHEHPLLRAENPSFDVEEFLISRSHTSLPDLRTELKEYLALLKDELVQLINDDYEAFISLSTDLRAEGTRLERLQTPMLGLRSEIEVCHYLTWSMRRLMRA
jgi:COG (conserved oligomeric Golgi) complex component, COG2